MFASVSIVAAVLAAVLLQATPQPTTQPATAPDRPRIVLAGDSTVTDHAGWGAGFARCYVERGEVINLARGGRSSRSFRDEAHWQAVLDANPDYVLIQFGHNDQPGKGPHCETDPQTTYRQFMTRYVEEARAAGATPVLVTSLARRRFNDDGSPRSDLLDYVLVVREIAQQLHVPLIELHDRSLEVYHSLGIEGVKLISPLNDDGSIDATHLNPAGSEYFGPLVADELRRVVPELQSAYRAFTPAPSTQPTTAAATAPATRRSTTQTFTPRPPRDPSLMRSQGARTLTVAADGTGDFRTVQAALEAVPDYNTDRTTIQIGPGVYHGVIVVGESKTNVSFIGSGIDRTILTYALNVRAPVPPGVPNRMNGNGVIVLGDDFHAENLTFRNTSGDHGQAMALRLQADRVTIRNCHLLGWQDTLLTHSMRSYFENCLIEGRVDFIYGAGTSFFENCEIRSKLGGYVTASSAPQTQAFGFVFRNCRLTSPDGTPTYLGRPWRPYASVIFLDCEMGGHIRPEGWHNWGRPENEVTARYAEHRSRGPGANPSARVPWSRQLDDAEAAAITPQSVLAGDDRWDPLAR
jgi:pectinesterase